MTRIGILGATGYAGAELVRLLAGHPVAEPVILTSRQYAGVPFDQLYPSMTGVVDLVCREYSADEVCREADIIFTALPHKLPMEIVPQLVDRGKRVVDLSADFRFRDRSKYESAYQPHSSAGLLDRAVYGLSEIYPDDIKDAAIVGNPGCYPTSALLPLVPIVKSGFIDPDTIVVDSKSGVSGAGRSVSQATHFCEVNESFKAYKVGAHRHTPEMEEVLSREAGSAVQITFTPHLVPLTRGMLTTTYAKIRNTDEKEIRNCLEEFYAGKPFVRLRPEARPPDILHVRGTNYCDIGLKVDERNDRLILISAIDNLVKGAAGQAVQNMNIMLGLEENTGLAQVPCPL